MSIPSPSPLPPIPPPAPRAVDSEDDAISWWMPGASKAQRIGVLVAVAVALILAAAGMAYVLWKWRRRTQLKDVPILDPAAIKELFSQKASDRQQHQALARDSRSTRDLDTESAGHDEFFELAYLNGTGSSALPGRGASSSTVGRPPPEATRLLKGSGNSSTMGSSPQAPAAGAARSKGALARAGGSSAQVRGMQAAGTAAAGERGDEEAGRAYSPANTAGLADSSRAGPSSFAAAAAAADAGQSAHSPLHPARQAGADDDVQTPDEHQRHVASTASVSPYGGPRDLSPTLPMVPLCYVAEPAVEQRLRAVVLEAALGGSGSPGGAEQQHRSASPGPSGFSCSSITARGITVGAGTDITASQYELQREANPSPSAAAMGAWSEPGPSNQCFPAPGSASGAYLSFNGPPSSGAGAAGAASGGDSAVCSPSGERAVARSTSASARSILTGAVASTSETGAQSLHGRTRLVYYYPAAASPPVSPAAAPGSSSLPSSPRVGQEAAARTGPAAALAAAAADSGAGASTSAAPQPALAVADADDAFPLGPGSMQPLSLLSLQQQQQQQQGPKLQLHHAPGPSAGAVFSPPLSSSSRRTSQSSPVWVPAAGYMAAALQPGAADSAAVGGVGATGGVRSPPPPPPVYGQVAPPLNFGMSSGLFRSRASSAHSADALHAQPHAHMRIRSMDVAAGTLLGTSGQQQHQGSQQAQQRQHHSQQPQHHKLQYHRGGGGSSSSSNDLAGAGSSAWPQQRVRRTSSSGGAGSGPASGAARAAAADQGQRLSPPWHQQHQHQQQYYQHQPFADAGPFAKPAAVATAAAVAAQPWAAGGANDPGPSHHNPFGPRAPSEVAGSRDVGMEEPARASAAFRVRIHTNEAALLPSGTSGGGVPPDPASPPARANQGYMQPNPLYSPLQSSQPAELDSELV